MNEALTSSPPSTTDLTDHVVICEFTPRGEMLVRELRSRDQPYVVVLPDADRAVELATEHTVVHGDPEEVESLDRANVGSARALVADDDDEANASIVLSARERSENVRVVSLVEDDGLADPETGVVERRDQRIVASSEVARTLFDSRTSHLVDLFGLEPDGRFLLSLGFHRDRDFEVVLL